MSMQEKAAFWIQRCTKAKLDTNAQHDGNANFRSVLTF